MNSKRVFKFSAAGAVTIMLLNPYAIEPAIERPNADDFPQPLAAVIATVLLSPFSEITSTKLMTAVA